MLFASIYTARNTIRDTYNLRDAETHRLLHRGTYADCKAFAYAYGRCYITKR